MSKQENSDLVAMTTASEWAAVKTPSEARSALVAAGTVLKDHEGRGVLVSTRVAYAIRTFRGMGLLVDGRRSGERPEGSYTQTELAAVIGVHKSRVGHYLALADALDHGVRSTVSYWGPLCVAVSRSATVRAACVEGPKAVQQALAEDAAGTGPKQTVKPKPTAPTLNPTPDGDESEPQGEAPPQAPRTREPSPIEVIETMAANIGRIGPGMSLTRLNALREATVTLLAEVDKVVADKVKVAS